MKSDIEKFKEMWYSRNPVHENNLDTGKDMFWETAELVAREYVEYITQQPLSGSQDSPKSCATCGDKDCHDNRNNVPTACIDWIPRT